MARRSKIKKTPSEKARQRKYDNEMGYVVGGGRPKKKPPSTSGGNPLKVALDFYGKKVAHSLMSEDMKRNAGIVKRKKKRKKKP